MSRTPRTVKHVDRRPFGGGRSMVFVLSLLLLSLLTAAGRTSARTIHLNAEGTGDYETIQLAVAAASDGDEIVLADGTYTGEGNYRVDYMGKAITIRSSSGNPHSCVIDIQGGNHYAFIFRQSEGSGSVLQGIKIINAYYTTGSAAIYCTDTTVSPIIRNCVVSHCSGHAGSALYCWEGTSPVVSRCTFVLNEGPSAIEVRPGASVSITNSLIAFNDVTRSISCESGDVSLSCCDIYGNSGDDWPEGIAAYRYINGNFSANPLICDLNGGDYRLSIYSPCADGLGCGSGIGAYGIGCYDVPEPPSLPGLYTLTGSIRDGFNRMSIETATVTLLRDGQPVAESPVNSLGAFVFFDLEAGTYRVRAQAPGYWDRQSAPIHVETQSEVDVELVTRTVVLVHGLAADGNIWTDSQFNYFDYLTESGYNAVVVDLYNDEATLDLSSYMLREEAHQSVTSLGIHSYDVIAHSMGGVVTRLMNERWPGRVRRLAMLGTPNHGSSLARNMMNLPRLLRILVHLALYEKYGDVGPAFEDLEPGSDALDLLNYGEAGVAGETDDCGLHAAETLSGNVWNSEISKHAMEYLEIAGTMVLTGDEEIDRWLEILMPGCTGDGVVAANSVKLWNDDGESENSFCYDYDFGVAVGHNGMYTNYAIANQVKTWLESGHLLHPPSPVAGFSETADVLQEIHRADGALAADAPAVDSIRVNGCSRLVLVFEWTPGSPCEIAVSDPQGNEVDVHGDSVVVETDGTLVLSVPQPADGTWRYRLSSGTEATFSASVLGATPRWLDVEGGLGRSAREGWIEASLREGDEAVALPGATLSATIFRDDDVVARLRLYDDGTHGDRIAGDGLSSVSFPADLADDHSRHDRVCRLDVAACLDSTESFPDWRFVSEDLDLTPYPDIVVDRKSFALSAEEVDLADTLWASVDIVNQGLEDAETVVVELEVSRVVDSPRDTLYDLAPGERRPVVLPWTAIAFPGTLSVAVHASLSGEGARETRGDNNRATSRVVLSGASRLSSATEATETFHRRSPIAREEPAFSVFPNPVHTGATVRYRLPDAGHVSIQLHNVAGRRIRTIESDGSAGETVQVVWDGRDERGNPVGPGVYFMRLVSNGTARTERVVVVR